jgi:hypothetical protein
VIHLFLFDVDSVLVDAEGYLVALQDTVAHFARLMGLGEQVLTEDEVRTFEAYAIGSEWDSAPALVAALLVERLRREPALALPDQWPLALTFLGMHPDRLPRLDFGALAARIGARLAGQTGAACAAREVLWEEAQAIPGLLPATAGALYALLEALLGHTHDFYRAPVTRYFQHLAIGSQAVAQTYGVTPDFESGAYLSLYDRALLNPAARARLMQVITAGRVRAVLYTARPSLAPTGMDGAGLGYSPEAELARELVGLKSSPLIGLGRLQWLAQQTGASVVSLVKPSPVQGLAAIGAAWSGDERAALEAAFALDRTGELRPPLAGRGPAAVHVFEDAVRGLDAVERGVEELRAAGVTLAYYPYGIVPSGGAKREAMAARGIPCYPSVNEAIEAALGQAVR